MPSSKYAISTFFELLTNEYELLAKGMSDEHEQIIHQKIREIASVLSSEAQAQGIQLRPQRQGKEGS